MKAPILLLLFVSISLSLRAQRISENALLMANGTQNSVAIEIPHQDAKEVDNLFKDYMKDKYGKLKKVKKSDESVLEAVRITDINGIDAFNLYSRVDASGPNSQLILWSELATDQYVSQAEHPQKYEAVVELLQDFEFHVRMHFADVAVQDQEKELENLEKELDKLFKEKEKLLSEIEKAENAIIKAKQGIADNEVGQEQTQEQIKTQREAVQKVRDAREALRKEGPSRQ